MSCIRSCYDKESSNFGHGECATCVHRDGGPVQPVQGKPGAWPIRGVRVEGDKVIVSVTGGNEAARWLCGELLATLDTQGRP